MPVSNPDAASSTGGTTVSDGGRDLPQGTPATPCVGTACPTATCPGAPTSISGTVYAPNGKLPLYNVTVYIPSAPLDPLPVGVSCDRCGVITSGRPIVATLSDSEGKFTLSNVPSGTNIPLVLQVGKWRRQVVLPNVLPCQDNVIGDANLTRLPRNRMEGDMPKVAVATGDCDQLGCLLPKLGIDPAEFGVAGEDKAIIYYKGASVFMSVPTYGPPNMRPAQELWSSEATLSNHDVTMLSCECREILETKSRMSFTAMTNYLGKGGRIFGSHFSYVWLQNATDPALTAAVPIVPTMTSAGQSPMTLDTTFPKGKALADWLKFLHPTLTYGQLPGGEVFDNMRSVAPPTATAWASSPSKAIRQTATDGHPRIVTVNTPAGVPADKQCGRAAHLDTHIATEEGNYGDPKLPFPATCGDTLTKGETALAFLFFDLSSCVQPDDKPPVVVIP